MTEISRPKSIIDSHVHLWDPRTFRMAWLDSEPSIRQPFLPMDFAAHTEGLPVEGFVYLEVDVAPHYALSEPRWVIEQAQTATHAPKLFGVVAHAPLEYGNQARQYLHELTSISPLVKGVRRLLQGESDLNFCLREQFLRGVQMLPEFNLSFDICIKHAQLKPVIEMVRRCPQTQFILDHIAKPDIARSMIDPWRDDISALAALPNVVCKLSGMVTEASHTAWSIEDLRPYVQHVIAQFGADRIMFGGDWPVCLLASSYTCWVQTLQQLTSHLSESDSQKLWHDNAQRVYKL